MLKEDLDKIRIPALSEHEDEIVFKNKGHQSFNSFAGNLIVNLEVEKSEVFWRKGLDLWQEVEF